MGVPCFGISLVRDYDFDDGDKHVRHFLWSVSGKSVYIYYSIYIYYSVYIYITVYYILQYIYILQYNITVYILQYLYYSILCIYIYYSIYITVYNVYIYYSIYITVYNVYIYILEYRHILTIKAFRVPRCRSKSLAIRHQTAKRSQTLESSAKLPTS